MQLKTDKMLAEKEGAIGWITFNNPERRNAVSLEMWEALDTIVEAFADDADIRVLVMKGAGDKAFVSGADISQFEKTRANAEAVKTYDAASESARSRIDRLEKPLIAMIRGFCMGGGLGIAMRTDIRIASEDAQFGIPAARLGVAYSLDNLQALVRLVGPGAAKNILFTGDRFSAREAQQMGLVERVVPADELEQHVRELAQKIARNAPISVKASKLTIREVLADPATRDMGVVDRVYREAFDSADYVEGRRAFMEKRKPNFTGR